MAKIQSAAFAVGALTLTLGLAPVFAESLTNFAVSLTVRNVCQVGFSDENRRSAQSRPDVSCSVNQPYRIERQNISADDPVTLFAAANRWDTQGGQMWVIEF